MLKYNDFAALIEAIKAMDEEEKSSLVIHEDEDEGIVFVIHNDEVLFSADAINFVHAFFILLGVDVDDNLSIK